MAGEFELARGIPLYRVNNKAPQTHSRAPKTFALPLLRFMFTFSRLKEFNMV